MTVKANIARRKWQPVITREVRIVTVAVWLIVSAILLSILIAPFVLSENAIMTVSRALQTPHPEHEQCVLCGMTRSFIAISHGQPTKALFFNKHSIVLYILFVLNEFFIMIFLAGRIRKLLSSPLAGISFRREMIKKKEAERCRYLV